MTPSEQDGHPDLEPETDDCHARGAVACRRADPLASPDPRRGLIFVGVFIAVCLVLAGIAFLPAMPTDVAPFVLALGPLVVALVLALVEGGGAISRLIRTLTEIPQNVSGSSSSSCQSRGR